MKRIKKLMFISIIVLFTLIIIRYGDLLKKVPDVIYLEENTNTRFDFGLPVQGEIYCISTTKDARIMEDIDFNEAFFIRAGHSNSYEAKLRLFGIIPYKKISFETVEEKSLIPIGVPVGMYGKIDGVCVEDTGSFISADGRRVNPCKDDLKPGDYILSYNGVVAGKKKDFVNFLNENKENEISLQIRRNGIEKELSVSPVLAEDGAYKIGAWIKDSIQGIGTITFADNMGNYKALGHGVNDSQLRDLIELSKGSLYKLSVLSFRKGEARAPGEMVGVIQYTQEYKIGTINGNTDNGIYGQLSAEAFTQLCANKPYYRVGYKEEIVPGKAYILVDFGDGMKEYEIEIEEIRLSNVDKGLIVKVTDEELLELTGGIVQGMSGSPIIQDDKMIGAITHVFVNDPTKGYGIFIEHMIQH